MVLEDSISLSQAQIDALILTDNSAVVAIWHREYERSLLGCKPWFGMTVGVLPRTLHTLWLAGLLRLDKKTGVYDLATSVHGQDRLCVGRARLTPAGARWLAAHYAGRNPDVR